MSLFEFRNKNYQKTALCIVFFVLSLAIFTINKLFKAELIFIYNGFVNGKEFKIADNEYIVSDDFIIFGKEDTIVYLLHKKSMNIKLVSITEYISHYFKHLIESNDIDVLEIDNNCKLYNIVNSENGLRYLVWFDERKKIQVEVQYTTHLPDLQVVCGIIRQKL